MQKKTGSLLIVLLLLFGGTLFAVWQRHASQVRAGAKGSTSQEAGRSDPHGNPFLQDKFVYVTHAASVGPFLVSIRNIRSDAGYWNLRNPYLGPPRPLGSFTALVQICAADADLLKECQIEEGSVRGRDDTGREILCAEPLPEQRDGITSSGIKIFFVRMNAPSDRAACLTELTGSLKWTAANHSTVTQPFRLADIPFPSAGHLIGFLSPRLLTEDTGLPSGLTVLSEQAMQPLADRLKNPVLPPGTPPQRLLLGMNTPARFPFPLPDAADHLTLRVQSGRLGAITLMADAGDGAQKWMGTVWEGEPFLILLPRQANRGERQAVAVRLVRDLAQGDLWVETPNVFPPPIGQAGGAIATQIRVEKQPFGRGILRTQIQQWQGDGWSATETITGMIAQDGSLLFSNLAPGRYRIRWQAADLKPILPPGEVAELRDFLQVRFGVSGGHWSGEQADDISVRSGQTTRIFPLQWTPSH